MTRVATSTKRVWRAWVQFLATDMSLRALLLISGIAAAWREVVWCFG